LVLNALYYLADNNIKQAENNFNNCLDLSKAIVSGVNYQYSIAKNAEVALLAILSRFLTLATNNTIYESNLY
jgi:hypothetical protein